ncbi:hypothetical protein QZH41_009571, partial [Actinostola sp. cb2023]
MNDSIRHVIRNCSNFCKCHSRSAIYIFRFTTGCFCLLYPSVSSCGNPGNIPHGRLIGVTDFSVESRVIYKCISGYRLKGKSGRKCKANGRWTRPPTCVKAPCLVPVEPKNGVRLGTNFKHGQIVRFRCNKDFRMSGSSFIICSNGQWNNDSPKCYNERCSYNRPANSQTRSNTVIGSTLKHGTTLNYGCQRGYTLVGQPNTRCDDGRWSPGIPQCKASCSDPGPIQHGWKIGNTFTHRSVVSYVCNYGYTLDRSSPLICNDGRWDRSVPICK